MYKVKKFYRTKYSWTISFLLLHPLIYLIFWVLIFLAVNAILNPVYAHPTIVITPYSSVPAYGPNLPPVIYSINALLPPPPPYNTSVILSLHPLLGPVEIKSGLVNSLMTPGDFIGQYVGELIESIETNIHEDWAHVTVNNNLTYLFDLKTGRLLGDVNPNGSEFRWIENDIEEDFAVVPNQDIDIKHDIN